MIRILLASSLSAVVLLSSAYAVVESALDSGDPWPMYMNNMQNTGRTSRYALTAPQLRWEVPLPITAGTDFVEFAPVLIFADGDGDSVEERMIITPSNEEIRAYAVDELINGAPKLLWRFKPEDGAEFVGKISVGDIYTGSGSTKVKTLYAATGNGTYAMPITPEDPMQDIDQDLIRMDDSLWAGLQTPAPGSNGGFTPITIHTSSDDYKSIVIGTHGNSSSGLVVARDAFSGTELWTYAGVGSGIGDGQPQPAVAMNSSGTADVYITGDAYQADQLQAFRLDSDGDVVRTNNNVQPVWVGDIDVLPTGVVPSTPNIYGGTYASATIGGNYVYVPADAGVVQVFDRTATPDDDPQDPDDVPVMDAVDRFVESTGQSNPNWNRDFMSTTIGLYAQGSNNYLFAPREASTWAQPQMRLIHSSGNPVVHQENYGDGRIFGGPAVDNRGSSFFRGQAFELDGDFVFDLQYEDPGDENSDVIRYFSAGNITEYFGMVTPIDSDGSIYVLGRKEVNGEYFLWAFTHSVLGDMNTSGTVNNADIQLFVNAMAEPERYNSIADMDQDGDLDETDEDLFVCSLPGASCGGLMAQSDGATGSTDIPEPSIAFYFALLVPALVFRPRWRCRWPGLSGVAAGRLAESIECE
jgi:hypothetical protein